MHLSLQSVAQADQTCYEFPTPATGDICRIAGGVVVAVTTLSMSGHKVEVQRILRIGYLEQQAKVARSECTLLSLGGTSHHTKGCRCGVLPMLERHLRSARALGKQLAAPETSMLESPGAPSF